MGAGDLEDVGIPLCVFLLQLLIGLRDSLPLRIETAGELGIVELDNAIALLDFGSIVGNPLDGRLPRRKVWDRDRLAARGLELARQRDFADEVPASDTRLGCRRNIIGIARKTAGGD